jgi:hypothetical protein
MEIDNGVIQFQSHCQFRGLGGLAPRWMIGKANSKRPNLGRMTCGESGDRGAIDSRREKDSNWNIAHQVVSHGLIE